MIERSNGTSGEVLRARMVRVASRVSVVRRGGSSSSSDGSADASVSQPSVVRMRFSLSKRLELVGERAAAVMHRLGDRIVRIVGRIVGLMRADSENK